MADGGKGFGEQLFARLQGKGLSRSQIYKALALQRLNEEVMELGAQGLIPEPAMLEISKISSAARQKQLAEIAVERQLPANWIKELVRLIRNAEKAASDKEGNKYWDFFFEVKDHLEREGATKELLERVKNFTPDRVAAEAGQGGDRQVVDYRKYTLETGKGLDVGTSNICAAVETSDSHQVLFNIQRNAFLDVRSDTFTKKMLMKLGVDHIVQGDKGYVIGDAAFELANIFEKNTRRPMKDGMISPLEPEAMLIVSLIISQLLGPPKSLNEICAYSVPADPVDAERNVIYHKGALEQVLRKLGYTPKHVLEGHAVVFGELQHESYTGIGISAGAGMFNICIAYRSMPALVFATSRGGDWIDNNVSTAMGIPSSQVCAVKESGVDLMRPRDRVEEAICIYYRNLIQYTLESIREKFESSQNMPTFSEPISVICAGGTSMIKGFIDVFREEFTKINFPIDIKEIRMAKDPLHTVSAGCLAYGQEETRALTQTPQAGAYNVGRSEPSSKPGKIDTKRFEKRPDVQKVVISAPVVLPTHDARREEKVIIAEAVPLPKPDTTRRQQKVVIAEAPAIVKTDTKRQKVATPEPPPAAPKPETRRRPDPPKPPEKKEGLGILDDLPDDSVKNEGGLGLLDEMADDPVDPSSKPVTEKPPREEGGISFEEMDEDEPRDLPLIG